MTNIFAFGILNNKQKEKIEILLSNKLAVFMLFFSLLWTIFYVFVLPNFCWIPISSIIVSILILCLNYFKQTKISRIIAAISYSSILFLTHGLLVNKVQDFFIPIYIIMIAMSLFSWNLFLKSENKSLQFTFIYNLFLICSQSFFNTYWITEINISNLLHQPLLIFLNYVMAISIFYFSLNFFFNKLTKQNLVNERLIANLRTQNEKNKLQNSKLIANKSRIEQQQRHIEKQNVELHNHILQLEETKKLLIQKEAETRSINHAIYDNFLIAEYNIDGKITNVNQNLIDFIGLPKEELIHHQEDKMSALDLHHDVENQIHFMRFWSQIRKGQSLSKEHKFKLPHKTLWFQSTFAPILDENGYAKQIISINQDISNLKQQQAVISHKNSILIQHTNTLMNLSKDVNIYEGNWEKAIEQIILKASECLQIHRVSIWEYKLNTESIYCNKLYLKEENKFEFGIELYQKDFPNYFDALFHEKIIIANNATTHDDTKEFKDIYLTPLNILSMLDIPIFYQGYLWGVICCEYKYTERLWTPEDISFIKSCSDMISLSIASLERKQINEKITLQQEEIILQNHELIHQKEELLTQKENIAAQKIIIENKNKQLLDSINYAKRIQDAILPTEDLFKKYFKDYFIFYQPKDIISGDFYWLKEVNGKIFLAAIDCTGHGVPGALVSIVANNVLNRSINQFHLDNPADILNKANEIISFELNQHNNIEVYDGMDICFICIDTINKSMLYAGAFNPLYIINEQNELIEIKANRASIGFDLITHDTVFHNHTIDLSASKKFYLFSDGFADQFGGEKEKKFSYKQLKDILLKNHTLSFEEQKNKLEKTFNDWKGFHEQIDDVLVIGISL